MIFLHQSKSYTCETSLADQPKNLDKHHSLSLLDSIPGNYSATAHSSLSTLSFSPSKSSSSSSSRISSNSLNVLLDKEVLNKSLTEKTQSTKNNVIAQKTRQRKDKKAKYTVVTAELASFKVRRNTADSGLYFLSTEAIDDDYFQEIDAEYDKYGRECDLLSSDEVELVNSEKKNKYNKRVKLKTLIKKKEIISLITPSRQNQHVNADLLKRCSLSKTRNSLCKKSTRLYIKYNLYKKLNESLTSSYVPSLERAKHLYSKRRVDKVLNKDAISSNKKVNAIVSRQHKSSNLNHTQQANVDPPVVIINSLGEHSGANSELNQTYDDLYLEFLISIQHRDITPEDYEYLSRLDEMVKKKTVNDNILKSLKTETITSSALELIEREQEVCGICLEQYALDQLRKHLPCGHKFHADCIDNWLRNQSTNCPLDKIPVDPNFGIGDQKDAGQILNETQDYDNNEEEEDFNRICLISGLLNEMIADVEADNTLSQELNTLICDLIAKIEQF